MTRRNRIEVIYDILNSIREKGRLKPTHILYKANLSHKKMTNYLEELESKEMLKKREEHGKMFYLLTEKGFKFLMEYSKIKEFEKSFGLD